MSMIDLTELIHKTADLVLSQPNFTGQFIFHEQERRIFGDEVSLKLVFSNLFQNAIKYAGSNSLISVTYIYEDGQLNVAVSDNGSGIDTREYKSIFMKFYRVGDENTRENKGTGLGLFLVKQILKSHKANIRAEANTPQGTTFYITFK
jgi:hypothetical protein